MKSCCVPRCNNNSRVSPRGISFHEVPVHNYDKWVATLETEFKRSFTERIIYVCSCHFAESDFKKDTKKILLKRTAVPNFERKPVTAPIGFQSAELSAVDEPHLEINQERNLDDRDLLQKPDNDLLHSADWHIKMEKIEISDVELNIESGNLRHRVEAATLSKNASGLDKHQCGICNTVYHSGSQLLIHMTSHSDEENFQCKLCDRKFSLSRKLFIERLSLDSTNTLKCGSCTGEFFYKAKQARRVLPRSREKNREASVVRDEQFKIRVKSRSDRALVYLNATELFESLCRRRKALASGRSRKTHQPVHGIKEESDCSACDETVRFPSDRSQHSLPARNGVECGKELECAQVLTGLKRSLEMKPSDTKFRCNVSFTRRAARGNHMLTCGGEKPYKSEVGGKDLVCSVDILRPVVPYIKIEDVLDCQSKESEPQVGNLECNVCQETFNLESVLAKHVLVHENYEEHKAASGSIMLHTEFVLGL